MGWCSRRTALSPPGQLPRSAPGGAGGRGDPYRRIARIYDAALEPMNGPLRRIGMRMLVPQPGHRVLDVGCGTGTHLALYRQAGCEVHGIDLSPAMLERARRRLGEGVDLQVADAVHLPYPDSCFDIVVAATILHELDAQTRAEALAEMRRTLASGGGVLVIDFHPGPLRPLKGTFTRAFSLATEVVAGRIHFRHFREFMAAGGMPALVAPGLRIDQQRIVAGGNIGIYLLRAAEAPPEPGIPPTSPGGE